MANNSLTHEDDVKFYENYLNRSRKWDEFIKIIEDNYELNDINSFDEYLLQYPIIGRLFSYFKKIVECNPENVTINKSIFKEFYLIAEFQEGKKEEKEVKKLMSSKLAKVVFLIAWITKLENEDNKTDYSFDLDLFQYKNMSSLIKVDNLIANHDDILQYFNQIEINGFSQVKEILFDNINSVICSADAQYLESIKDQIVNVNAFHFNRIKERKGISWEEHYILNMLNIKFEDRKIIPMFSIGKNIIPDYNKWTEDKLETIQKFYNCSIADFVIETVRYVLFHKLPSSKIVEKHIDLFLENFEKETTIAKRYYNSSFEVISYLFEDKYFSNKDFELDNKKELFSRLGTIRTEKEILYLGNHNIFLNNEQIRIRKKYYDECYRHLDSISNISDYCAYLSNTDNTKSINNEYFKKSIEIFDKFIDDENNDNYPCLFIDFMLFLMRLKSNANIDKELLEYEMIHVQELWEYKYYDICAKNLNYYKQGVQINNEEIESFNESILDNIFSLPSHCIIASEQDYLKYMEKISDNPFLALVSKLNLNRRFPINEKLSFDIENHDIDKLTCSIIDEIKSKYSYKFLNPFDADIYIKIFHDIMKQKAYFYFAMFNITADLYDFLKKELENQYELIDYNENIQLAHLTQLFPIIEIMIKKLGKIYHIFPYKEDEKHFMQHKDPSSILRIILENSYGETKDFEAVQDILFIYHFLYNGNSLNIRNECIHGRDYLSGPSLLFAFKVTLSCLCMIIKRIEIINIFIQENT